MNRIRIGLVGCGSFGVSHLQAFRAISGAEVAAVFDTDRARAEQVAAEFGVPVICESLDEICSLPEVEAVDVITPEEAHLNSVLKALGSGKHVFVEKPLATDLTHCRDMIEAARRTGRILMPGHILRFETKYAMLKEEVDSGRLGGIVSMQARRNRPKNLLPVYGRTHPALENCIHDVDLMLWYAGTPVKRVRGYGRHATGRKHPDTFWGVIEFEGGAIGVVETIWLLPAACGVQLDDAFQLIGSGGVANVQLFPGALTFWRESGFHLPDVSYDPRVFDSARGALRDELAYFCDCVRDGRDPAIITATEAMRAVRVVLALIESAESDREITLAEWD